MKIPLGCLLFSFLLPLIPGLAAVRVEEVPEKGLQPEVVTGTDGVIHLVYLKGSPNGTDVRYTWRKSGDPWQPSITVNSTPKSGIAMGTIRGPQIALNGTGTVLVLWNGVGGKSQPSPLWFSRKSETDSSFEEQRNLLGDETALDGGASITADSRGKVFVVWHGNLSGAKPDESRRLVFLRTSTDQGTTFGKAEALNEKTPGVCACCSLRALAGPNGELSVFFRSAVTMERRSMTLLSHRIGEKWQLDEIDPWKVAACPMSSSSLLNTRDKLLGAWETDGRVKVGWVSEHSSRPVTIATKEAKHPTVAINSMGKLLVAWVEGTGWNQGGQAGWAELDERLEPNGQRGGFEGVPAWGKLAVYAEPDGNFVILR